MYVCVCVCVYVVCVCVVCVCMHVCMCVGARGVSRIFIIGFPTSGLRRYFNRGGEATS